MSPWLLAILAGLIVALIQYGPRELRNASSLITAALRAGAVALVTALLLDAPAGRSKPVPAWVALDASLSMTRGDTTLWLAARDSARRAGADSIFLFGDSVRRADTTTQPHDQATVLRPMVERALGAGHPLIVVTDGEIDDPDAAQVLPPGSRMIVLSHPPRRDAAVASIEAPRAVVSGDTAEIRVGIAAGSLGSRPGALVLSLDGSPIAQQAFDSLPAFGERVLSMKVKLESKGAGGPEVLRAVATAAEDAEHRNDTLAVAVDVSRAASAVFASTSPDFDARYALAVLRGSLGIPTRGYWKVAPGEWRNEGTFAPVPESEVRQALHDAPVAVIHGDTAAFGDPRKATSGPLALIVTSATDGEWYPASAPASPIAPALSGVIWDSLPPVAEAAQTPTGNWTGIETRRGRGEERKPLVVGTDSPRRVAVVAAAGLWRWRFRGGVAADAFTAFWGGIFDWLAAERADRRAAVPDERVVHAGEPVRWRKGSPADSVVSVELHARGSARADSLTLRFPPDANVVESRPLAAGIYDVTTQGGKSLLAVNASREWLPRAPRVSANRQRGALSADTAPRLRGAGWAYALAILLLCAEWLLRRRHGMR
jgi:hypothetical protein